MLSGILGGEELILSLVFLSSLGLFPLWWILIFVTLGEFISDIVIFSLGRIDLFHKFKKIEKLTKLYKKADNLIMKVSKKSTFLTILYSKFIYGTRIFTLVYLSSKKTKWQKFLVSELLALMVWMSITVVIGWFAGASIKQFSLAFKNTGLTIALLVIFIILIIMMKKWIQTKLLKKQKQLN
ncbi:MAG: hypothetical protein ABIK26_07010 [Candidatus Omnitrophota bacterium]